jgi:hypothetical protein
VDGSLLPEHSSRNRPVRGVSASSVAAVMRGGDSATPPTSMVQESGSIFAGSFCGASVRMKNVSVASGSVESIFERSVEERALRPRPISRSSRPRVAPGGASGTLPRCLSSEVC